MPIGEVDLKELFIRIFIKKNSYLVEKEIYIQKMLIMDNFSKDYKLKPMYN